MLALQAALAHAHAGDQIWLAQGTYKPVAPGGLPTIPFTLLSDVQILGGFAGTETAPEQRPPGQTSILSGDINNGASPHAARILAGTSLSTGTLLDSLTITGSTGSSGVDAFHNYGGGLALLNSSPTIRRCVFRGNVNSTRGGGAAVLNGSATFEDCTFDGNTSSFGYNLASMGSSSTTVLRCRFIGDGNVTGGSVGIGIFSGPILASPNDHPALTVEDTLFAMADTGFSCPTGMGIYALQGTADVRRCDFLHNNTCGGGGGIAGEADLTVDRCRFIGNEGSADGGAALHAFSGHTTVTNSLFHAIDRDGFTTVYNGGTFRAVNCTFSYNGSTSGFGGGGFHQVILTQRAGSSLENCIFWGNQSRGGTLAAVTSSPAPARFDRCLVQGWTGSLPGTASFAADPRFVDADGPDNTVGTADDDLHLQPSSPALDRANNNALAATLDLDGLPRFRDVPAAPDLGLGTPPFADLGAYELQPPCAADFNHDGFTDFFDYDAFVDAFEQGDIAADFNADGFLDFFDYDAFVDAFEAGC